MRVNFFTLLSVVGMTAAVTAALTVWLVVQRPVAVADAISSGELEPLLSTLAREIESLMMALVRLL